MIVPHHLNSHWWGSPVGIIEDPAFLRLASGEAREALDRFAWVEYRAPYDAVAAVHLHELGFIHAESYCRCRIGLTRIGTTPSVAALNVRTAEERPFELAGLFAPFENERFDLLPGVSVRAIQARYERYMANLIAAAPKTSLEVSSGSGVQGWFLAEPRSPETVHLSLATRHVDATVSGAQIYQRALLEYARQGYRIGTATFTVRHAEVMNIYARLGALFMEPLEIWLRVRSSERSVSET